MALKKNKQKSDEIYAYPFDSDPVFKGKLSDWIRPCEPRRKWMDDTFKRFAYRCVPMTMANSLGWEIINPCAFEAIWLGEESTDSLSIKFDNKDLTVNPRSHFGSGIITWDLPVIFKTPPGVGMIVQGPANLPKHGVMPLQGFVETNWLPNGFTMNWKITEENKIIRFEKGEPFCRIFPYRIDYVENFQIKVVDSKEHPKFRQQVIDWANDREKGKHESELNAKGSSMSKGYWAANYVKGQDTAGNKQKDHKNAFRCKPIFENKT